MNRRSSSIAKSRFPFSQNANITIFELLILAKWGIFVNFALKESDMPTEEMEITADRSPKGTQRRLTLRKGEKLRHRTLVDTLFSEGETMYDFPFRLSYRLISREELENSFRTAPPSPIDSLQMLITVPKKKRRRAIDRVLMRRRIREAYRLNRLPLLDAVAALPGNCTLCMAFIYIHDKNADYSLIERKMKALLKKLADKLIK